MLYAIGQDVRVPEREGCVDNLVRCAVSCRRTAEDVHWLKENAELLRILICTNTPVSDQARSLYESFYRNAPSRMRFFPQYYRLILSLVRDLASVGYPEHIKIELQGFVRQRGFARGELSDLQRLEALYLLDESADAVERDIDLVRRVRSFAENAAFFAVPNRKAAFELTHLVFYLGGYGEHKPDWFTRLTPSLHNAGLIALLDRDIDLLAEVIVALSYCGEEPPLYWQQTVESAGRRIECVPVASARLDQDVYHEVLTAGWAGAECGGVFRSPEMSEGDALFVRTAPTRSNSPLRELSIALWREGDSRSGNWIDFMQRGVMQLSDASRSALHAAHCSSEAFPAFFSHFARSVGSTCGD